MVDGYRKNGFAKMAFEIFRQMQRDGGVKPNLITMLNILPACVDLTSLQHGKEIHAHIIKCGFLSNSLMLHSLIDMYSKCGSIEDGHQVFDEISEKGAMSWIVMIAGYMVNGYAEKALATFHQMQKDGVPFCKLVELMNVPHISMGNLVREELGVQLSLSKQSLEFSGVND